MGDVILVAPLLSFLHSLSVHTHIALLTSEPYAQLFRDDKRLSSIFTVKKGEFWNGGQEDHSWDMIIDLQNNKISREQTSRLHFTVIYRFKKMHMKRIILLFFRFNCYPPVVSVPLRYITTIGEKTPPDDLDYRIPFTKSSNPLFSQCMQHGEINRPVIAFFPFSAWKNKVWAEENYVSVGRFFLIKGWNVVIMGGANERERAIHLRDKIGYRCISLAGELDLYECGCVLKHCKLALGGDTGLSHLARACGVKCGFLFGPTTYHFGFQPHDDPGCIIFESQQLCRPCHPHGGNFCIRIDHACMKSIDPDAVINGLLELYHGSI